MNDVSAILHAWEPLSQFAAGSLVSGLWQGLVLAAGVGLCLRLMPKTTATLRFAIWTVAFLVLALLPFLHPSMGNAATPGAMVHIDVRWSFAIAALWLLLSLVRAVRLAISVVRLRTLWKEATPIEGYAPLPSGPAHREVQCCTSTEVDRPSVIGFFSPRILIPAWLFERLTPQELEQIVLHEMGHLRRADDWINLLQKLGLILFPLNPVLMWIERQLCFERELACDDGVLRSTGAPKAYATCLARLAEHRLDHRGLSLSLGAWGRQSELTRRVHSILRRGEGMGKWQGRAVMGAVPVALLCAAVGLSRCPQVVSFSALEAAPVAQAQMLPAGGRQDVVFHPAAAPHVTLVKASFPSGQASLGKPKQARRASTPALQRVSRGRNKVQRLMVLTSWEQESGVIVSGARERQVFATYAAVPTPDGWLVIQL